MESYFSCREKEESNTTGNITDTQNTPTNILKYMYLHIKSGGGEGGNFLLIKQRLQCSSNAGQNTYIDLSDDATV